MSSETSENAFPVKRPEGHRADVLACRLEYIYDAATDSWTTAQLSSSRRVVAGATVRTFALFAGGQNLTGSGAAVVDVYDSATGQWSQTMLSGARAAMASVSLPDLAMFAGGQTTTAVDIFAVPKPATLALGWLAAVRRRRRANR